MVKTSKILEEPPLTGCLLETIGSAESPEISNLQEIFLTGNMSSDVTTSLRPIQARLRTAGIVCGFIFIFSRGNKSLWLSGIMSYPTRSLPSFEFVASNIRSYHKGILEIVTGIKDPSTGLFS